MRTRMNRIACSGCGLIAVALATTTTAAMVDESGNVVSGGSGPDITFCQLDSLRMNGDAFEGIVGLSMATTSWNVGDQLLEWHLTPDSRHPFIAQNLYLLENDRFEQIGLAWHAECYDSDDCTRLRYHAGPHIDEYMVDAPSLEEIAPGQLALL